MPPQSKHRTQTSKQAKASFKARGSTTISDAERRKLARGAELLERAKRLKEQERRKKEWLKKRDEKDAKGLQAPGPAVLGTQRKLDRFGYKSSQCHLGAFMRPPSSVAQNIPIVPTAEPWETTDSEDLDDDDLLDIGAMTNTPRNSEKPQSETEIKVAVQTAHKCLDNGSQIARALSDAPPEAVVSAPGNAAQQAFTSFSSDGMGLTEEDLEELERGLSNPATFPLQARSQIQTQKDKIMMPPPRNAPAWNSRHLRSETRPSPPKPNWTPQGFSIAELESLIADDILLSQFG